MHREKERMKEYTSSSFQIIGHVAPLNDAQLAEMSREEFEADLLKRGNREREKRYQANTHYILREITGEYVLVPSGNLPGNMMATMNRSCAFLWRLLQEPKTTGDLISAAKQQFDDPAGELEQHILEFIEYRVKTGHIWEVK